jgi:hypothetical protein
MMRNISKLKAYEDEMYTLDGIQKYYGEVFNEHFRSRLAYAYLLYGMHLVEIGNKKQARNILFKSINFKYNLAKSQYFYLVLSCLPFKIAGKDK